MTDLLNETNTKVYSGVRKKISSTDPRALQYAINNLAREIAPWKPLLEAARQEPFFIDDELRHYDAMALLVRGIESSELFICTHGDNIVGFAYLSGIDGRSANLEAWTHPAYRASFRGAKIALLLAKEITEYCFRKFGDLKDGGGLGLLKLKAKIAIANKASLSAARALGFKPIGISPLEGLFNGMPTDMVLMELLNPALRSGPEVLTHGSRKLAEPAPVRGATAVQPTGKLSKSRRVRAAKHDNNTGDARSARRNAARSGSRSNASAVAAAKSKSNESKRAAAVRK